MFYVAQKNCGQTSGCRLTINFKLKTQYPDATPQPQGSGWFTTKARGLFGKPQNGVQVTRKKSVWT